jgi:diguanylate cyclase (GGDEF)-like protein/PAS domain S-box-containing protein
MKVFRGHCHFWKQIRGNETVFPRIRRLLLLTILPLVLSACKQVSPYFYNLSREQALLVKNQPTSLFYILAVVLLVIAALVIFAITFWNRSLKRAVELKSKDLQNSENKFRMIFETAAIGITTTDRHGRFLSANPALLGMLGYTAEEFMKFSVKDISHPGDASKNVALLKELWAGKRETFSYEKRNLHKDGHYVWGLLTNSIVRDSTGKPLFAIGMFEDISERKESEQVRDTIYRISQAVSTTENLDELYASIHAILGNLMPVENFYFALADPDNDLLHFPFFKDQYEHIADPIPSGRSLTSYILRNGKPLLLDGSAFDEMVGSGEVEQIGQKPVSWLGVPLIIEDRVIGVMAAQSYSSAIHYTQHDADLFTFISIQVAQAIERKRTEEALIHSEADMRALFAAITDVVIVLDKNGKYMKVSGMNTGLLYRPEEELVGHTLDEILDRKTAAAFLEQIGLTLSSHTRRVFEYSLLINGRPLWFSASISPIDDNSVIWVAHDITDRKLAEEALRLNEIRYHNLFEESPVSLWEEDFSAVKEYLDSLKQDGVVNFKRYFLDNPEAIRKCISKIKVIDINTAALKLVQARSKEELLAHFEKILDAYPQTDIIQEFVNIAAGLREFNIESWNRTINGIPIAINMKWTVSLGSEETLTRVIVAIEDISARKEAVEKLNYRSRFEELLTQISTRFINFPSNKLDSEINNALCDVRSFVNVDRVGVLKIDSERKTLLLSYECCGEGIPSVKAQFQNAPYDYIPWTDQDDTNKPLIVDKNSDPQMEILRKHISHNLEKIQSLAFFPMWANQNLIGIFSLVTIKEKIGWSQDTILMLQQFANILSNAIERSRLINEMNERAIRDELTGVLNRRGFVESARTELSRACRYGHSTGMILFDIDGLKTINDTLGHMAGDQVISEVIKCSLENIRDVDLFARWGGDEFTILLPETDHEAAVQTANRLCLAIHEHEFQLEDRPVRMTISVGVAATDRCDATIDSLFRQADQALYSSKNTGKNRVSSVDTSLPQQ